MLDKGNPHIAMRRQFALSNILVFILLLASCAPVVNVGADNRSIASQTAIAPANPAPTQTAPMPGELIDYLAQNGDTLPALAARFNTTIEGILAANPDIPQQVTTLPPGLPMQIPAYFLPLTSAPFHIVPDSEVVYSPTAIGFDLEAAIRSHPGFLASMTGYVRSRTRSAWELIELVAQDYSLHPRLLLTLLEYQSHALTDASPPENALRFPLGYEDSQHEGLYQQLLWAAERINDGYYGWRTGVLRDLYLSDGLLIRPHPALNAGTVALQSFFSGVFGMDDFEHAIGPEGFNETFRKLWGEPSDYDIELIPANLQQPDLRLPFLPGQIWTFSAGPHFSWGTALPLGALDFAPPASEGGCASSSTWVTAPIEGKVVRSEDARVFLDLDGDGDERTGWVLFFFHIASEDRVAEGSVLEAGGLIGHPSCEGGRATGTHFHFARKYNGEWIPAAGVLPFNLDGWIVEYGREPYQGTMKKGSITISASENPTSENRVYYQFP
jgi:LasA protease